MLSSDEIIYKILIDNKKEGNKLLEKFHIRYPSKDVIAQESNSIVIGVVSTEQHEEFLEASSYRDLTEILIVTKIKDYNRAVKVIKTVTREVNRLLKKNTDKFPNRVAIRNIAPEYNQDFVLNKGHIMVECITAPVDDDIEEEEIDAVCKILLEDMEIK